MIHNKFCKSLLNIISIDLNFFYLVSKNHFNSPIKTLLKKFQFSTMINKNELCF